MSDTLLSTALDAFHGYIETELAKYEPGTEFRTGGRPTKANPDGEDEAWWRENGEEQIRGYIQWREANPNLQLAEFNGVPAVEVEVASTIDESVSLRGFIDRVFMDTETGTHLIVDLKTGRNAPGSPLQLAFYRMALAETVGVDVQYGAYYMSRKNSLGPIYDLWYPREVIASWLQTASVMIDNELFIPHITSMCNSCGVKDHCYAVNPSVPAPLFFNPSLQHDGKESEDE